MDKKTLMGLGIGLAAGICNGLFGAGGGMLVVPALKKFCGLEPKRAHATSVAVILALSAASAGVYLFHGAVTLGDALPYLAGGVLGGFLGGKLLPKVSNRVISKLFGGFMVYAALRSLFGG